MVKGDPMIVSLVALTRRAVAGMALKVPLFLGSEDIPCLLTYKE